MSMKSGQIAETKAAETNAKIISGSEGQDYLIGQGDVVEINFFGQASQTIEHRLALGQQAVLNVDMSGSTLALEDGNLVLSINNSESETDVEPSRIVFLDLVNQANSENAPVLIINGVEVSSNQLIAQVLAFENGTNNIETAAGPDNGLNIQSGGGSQYLDDTGELLGMLETQGALQSDSEGSSQQTAEGNGRNSNSDALVQALSENNNTAPVILKTGWDEDDFPLEITDGADGENNYTHSTFGGAIFIDPDLGDVHTVTLTPDSSNYVGIVRQVIVELEPGLKAVEWLFEVADADLDFLAEGQTISQRYTVVIDDGNGGVVTEQVAINLTGSNDGPIITSATDQGEVIEVDEGQDDEILGSEGQIVFEDVDLIDTHSVRFEVNDERYLGEFRPVLDHENKTINWSFTVAGSAVEHLAAGESLTQVYDVTIDDGHGGTAQQDVMVTIHGTNDAPIITSEASEGTVTEIRDGALGENETEHREIGAISFSDADISDTHRISFTAGGDDYLGRFSPVLNQSDGTILWTFSVEDSVLNHLARGENLTQIYRVTIDDGNGGSVTEEVVITIEGTNDQPVISSAVTSGSIDEIADNQQGENNTELSAEGSIHFTDNDQSDEHYVTYVSGQGSENYLGRFTPVMDQDNKVVNWAFTVDDADLDHLSEGDVLTQTYEVAIRDGNGAPLTQEVVITITGSNDAPEIVDRTSLRDHIRVNSETEFNHVMHHPSVSHLPDGGWVSVWMYYKPVDENSERLSHVKGRAFNADGSPRGDDFDVFPPQENYSRHEPDVTSLANGGWFVSWNVKNGPGLPNNLYGRLYDADGSAREIMKISDLDYGSESSSTVTALNDGGWVVSWHSTEAGAYVKARIFNSDGTARGDEFQVSDRNVVSIFLDTEMTSLANGNWVVTWHELSDPTDVTSTNIFMRAYDAAGNPLTEATLVNSHLEGTQRKPSVVGLEDGSWIVVWHGGDDQDGSGNGIFGQAYNPDGTARGSEFLVNSETAGDQEQVTVTSLADGGWVAVWASDIGEPGRFFIKSQVFDANGSRQGDEITVEHMFGPVDENIASVAGLEDGGWVVTLRRSSQIYTKTYNADGSLRSYEATEDGLTYFAFNEGGDPVALFSDLELTDADTADQIETATVAITDFVVGDVLDLGGYSLPAGMNMSYDSSNGVLTLTGAASPSEYKAALEHVNYHSTSDNPDVSGLQSSRTIEVTVSDGIEDSDVISTTVSVIGNSPGLDIIGNSEDDVLTGTEANDLIAGGHGEDTLNGGAGADVFIFRNGETGNDIITDFSIDQGDILHLGELLSAETRDSLDQYLHFTQSGAGTRIEIDVNGDGSGTDKEILLQGVDLTQGGSLSDTQIINNLLEQQALITDQ
ncbi:VCBS domain-containing protein [Kiloniella sp. EL199]|uniref:VCBS domain-containing protein n=1 Tax=Kiloniella sp. EL199 TaxID=2107581 RepID=UPI000EA07A58|nr:VCBS domain-containing protein [Kiloniella sp. EL199]